MSEVVVQLPMLAWLLLALTLFCVYLAYETYRWGRGYRRAPFEMLASMWGGLRHYSVTEQRRLTERALQSSDFGGLFVLFAFLAALLAVTTVGAFLQ